MKVNGRERYFKNINFTNSLVQWPHCRVVGQTPHFFSLEEAGVQVQIPAWLLPGFSFPFIVFFLPFGFVLFILTADPVNFARFLRKPISSLHTLTAFVSEILLVRTISA